MGNRKNLLLCALSAFAAVAAIAVPASASASVWLRAGEPLSESVEFPLTGGEVIEVGGGAMVCSNTAATMTTEGGSSAEITAYEIDKANCFGLSGDLAECEVTSASAKGLPWSVTVNTADLTAAGVGVVYSFDEACAVHEIEFGFSALTLTPEEPSAIRLFHFGQETTAKVDGKEAVLTFGGEQNMPEEDLGVYGIG